MANRVARSRSPGRPPRLQDVAELAGVSLGAASRILRGDCSSFSEGTSERVVAAASTLGWRRNLLVSGMQTGKTRTVGVVIPPYDSFWIGVLAGIHERLGQADYLPITVWLGDLDHMPHFEADESQGIGLMNRLLDRRVDGLILWPPFGLAYYHHARELQDRTVPVVMIDYHSDAAMCDAVTTDEAAATRLVARHLVDLGHRQVAYISSREVASQSWAVERRRGLERACAAAGIRLAVSKLNVAGDNALDVARKVLRRRPRPSAIVTATDHEAVDVYRAAAEAGLRIPDDLAVVGFADLDFAAGLAPPLTTVRQRAGEIGARAAAMVLDRIAASSRGSGYRDVQVKADLVVRGSTVAARRT